jgi:hypothetical protein
VIEIAQALARLPGRLEFDRDEAHRIGEDMYDAFERGEFTDEEGCRTLWGSAARGSLS